MKTPRILGFLITSVLATGAFATGENTVTSKSYVDAMDATKQGIIPASGTNASEPGESVITYTDTAGTIGERGFFDYKTSVEGEEAGSYTIAEGHYGDIVTAADYVYDINTIFSALKDADVDIEDINTEVTSMNSSITDITNQMNAETRETIEIQKLTCYNDKDGCTLWQIADLGVAHKLYSCTTQTVATDCPACGTGTLKACENNICKCNACKAANAIVSNVSECCSGVSQACPSGKCTLRCGCSTTTDCPSGSTCDTSTSTCS